MEAGVKYKRVMLKLSGGALAGDDGFGFDEKRLAHLVNEILSLAELGLEVGVVVGGGNILRGKDAQNWGVERTEADNIGMLGTVINGLMLRGALKSRTDKEVRVMTAMAIPSVAEPLHQVKGIATLQQRLSGDFCGRQRATVCHDRLSVGAAGARDRLRRAARRQKWCRGYL